MSVVLPIQPQGVGHPQPGCSPGSEPELSARPDTTADKLERNAGQHRGHADCRHQLAGGQIEQPRTRTGGARGIQPLTVPRTDRQFHLTPAAHTSLLHAWPAQHNTIANTTTRVSAMSFTRSQVLTTASTCQGDHRSNATECCDKADISTSATINPLVNAASTSKHLTGVTAARGSSEDVHRPSARWCQKTSPGYVTLRSERRAMRLLGV